MDDKDFKQLVKEALEQLPKKVLKRLDNVAIVIDDRPSQELRREIELGPDADLLGLYQGIPLTKRENYTLVLPDKITIFKQAILASSKDEAEIRQLVADTVWHEVGHHFGLDETEVRSREQKRRQQREQRHGDG